MQSYYKWLDFIMATSLLCQYQYILYQCNNFRLREIVLIHYQVLLGYVKKIYEIRRENCPFKLGLSLGDFNLTSEMVQKAMEAKLLRKAQRQAALDAAKMAKRERGYLRLLTYLL